MSQREEHWRELYPFTSQWMGVPKGRIHYLDEGSPDAAPLLFVHGNPTWSFHWRGLVGPLQHKYRTVAIDHLGCGLSDRPQEPLRLADHISHLVQLVEQLDLRGVTLVAQDWGGAIGLGAMLQVPERLSRIVLFNTGAFPPWYIPRRIAACRLPVLGKWGVQGLNLFTRAALTMTLSRRQKLEPQVAAGYLDVTRNWAMRRQVYEFVADIPRSTSHPTWQTLETIERGLPSLADRPAMLVWGMRDWCFRPDCLEKFEQVWPDAQVHRLEDVGHWVVEDASDQALQLVESFLGRTDTEAVS